MTADPWEYRCNQGCELDYYGNEAGSCSCHRPFGSDCEGWEEMNADLAARQVADDVVPFLRRKVDVEDVVEALEPRMRAWGITVCRSHEP